jgi:hypothetical protein
MTEIEQYGRWRLVHDPIHRVPLVFEQELRSELIEAERDADADRERER